MRILLAGNREASRGAGIASRSELSKGGVGRSPTQEGVPHLRGTRRAGGLFCLCDGQGQV